MEMKHTMTVLLILGMLLMLAGCNERDLRSKVEYEQPTQTEPMEQEAAPSEVYNAVYGYAVEIPDALAENCTIETEADGSEIRFLLKESGDFVAAVCTAPAEQELNLGERELVRQAEYVVYLQLPTCATLNQEEMRQLWEDMIDETEQIQADSVQPLAA